MKKQMIVGIALAIGMLSVGAISASAASSCCNDGKCTDKQSVQQFSHEVAGTASVLDAKELELRELYGQDGFDSRKAAELESEIAALKSEMKLAGVKVGVGSCCRS